VLFIGLITLLLLVVMGGISVGLAIIAPWWLGYAVLLLLNTAASAGIYSWMLTLAEKKYRQYEL
jgi:hypothetical protein